MIEIISSDQLLSSFLPINSKQTGIRWIFSKFNIIIPYDNSVLSYNSLSKCFVKTPLSFANIIKRNSIEYKDLLSEDFDILTSNGFLIPEQTDELKTYFQTYIKSLNSLSASFQFSDEELKIIENMNGDYDCKKFAESNKSLMTGPGRNEYREYAVDLNYYTEHFEIIKSIKCNFSNKNSAKIG